MRVTAIVLLLLSGVALAVADPMVFELTQNGSRLGQNTYDLKADGTFSSKTEIAVGNVKIESTLTGKFVKNQLVEFKFEQTTPAAKISIVSKDGKANAIVNGKAQPEAKIEIAKAVFSNYHPAVAATIFANLDKAVQGARNLQLSIVDSGGGQVPVSVTPQSSRKIVVNGKERSLQCLTLTISGIGIEIVADETGAVVGEKVGAQKVTMIVKGYEAAFEDPVAKYKELSQPTYAVKRVKAVAVKMRDGVTLYHDAAMPDAEGKFPVIFERTPYGREMAMNVGAEWWAKRGYIYIVQDCRGRHTSEGTWDPFVSERQDGKDTIDWIAAQPWCTGKVGMIGGSYGGYVQWAAAVERPAALKCIVPQVSPPDAMRNIPYEYGVFCLMPNLWWANLVRDRETHLERATQPLLHPEKLNTLPLSKVDDAVFGVDIPFYNEWLMRDGMSAWKGRYDTLADMPKVEIPALHISGWWDGDGIGTKLNWATMRAAGRKNQWLIYGPWPHAFNTTSKVADVDFGPTAILELDSLYLRWFDTWLKGMDVGIEKVPHVQVFITGANRWVNLDDWPAKASKEDHLYFANGATLEPAPLANGKTAQYTYDPAKAAIPKKAKGNLMAEGSLTSDIGKSDEKQLIYRSAPMTKPLAIGGPLSVDLYFSTNVVATDFYAVIYDVDEKGKAHGIGQPAKLDVRYMTGLDSPKLIKPGQIYKAHLELWDTAHQFAKGHRIAVQIVSSMFPSYARNLNTGEPIFSATKIKVAKQTIYQDAKHPSRLNFYLLPVQ